MKRTILIFLLSSICHASSQELLVGSELTQSISSNDLLLPEPKFESPRKNIYISTGLSFLVPGLGHTYLGDSSTAFSIMTTAGLSASTIELGNNSSIHMTASATLLNTWFYGIYAAYRDTRKLNGPAGYTHAMPTESFKDLALAPFRFSVLKKPEVWGGLLGKLGLAVGAAYLMTKMSDSVSSDIDVSPLAAFPVGIGEEALFRGFLQSSLLDTCTPPGAIGISSVVFGACHIPNAFAMHPSERTGYYAVGIPLITAAGAYYGWLTYKNNSLKEAVAVHAWYDFTLFALSALANSNSILPPTQFRLSIPF